MPRTGRPRIHPPDTTSADRRRLSRERAREAGPTIIHVESAQARADLDRIKREGETDKAALERTLREARG